MTGKIKVTFEPTTIEYPSVPFEFEVEDEKRFMDVVATTKIGSTIISLIDEILSAK